MATAYRSRNKFGTIDEKRDVFREGEARDWANAQLRKGKKVEIGYYSVHHSIWIWFPYKTPNAKGKILGRNCQYI